MVVRHFAPFQKTKPLLHPAVTIQAHRKLLQLTQNVLLSEILVHILHQRPLQWYSTFVTKCGAIPGNSPLQFSSESSSSLPP